MGIEIRFERILVSLETTRGAAEPAPTHQLNLAGKMTPKDTKYRPEDTQGTLIRNYRHVVTHRGMDWQAEGAADVNLIPVIANMAVKPVTTPTTPSGATLARLWEFVRSVNSDDIKSATMWWGDPTIQIFQSTYTMINEVVIKNDASSDSGATVMVKGAGQFPTQVATPTIPASISWRMLPGQMMQMWIDTSSAIGTTAVTGRLISVEHTIPTGVTYKHFAEGPTSKLDFSSTGRDWSAAKTKIVLEVPDMTQYDQWAAASTLKCRIRHNGPLIEAGFYYYVEFDIYGPFDALDWGENVGSNRTIQLTIESEYDPTLAADYRLAIQNARTSL